MEGNKKYTVSEFASKIKAKYPQYADIEENELVSKIIDKYPEYKEQIIFNKKKEPTTQDSEQPATPSIENGQLDREGAISQIITPEIAKDIAKVEADKKLFQENPYAILLRGKNLTPKETFDELKSQVQEIDTKLEGMPASSSNLELRQERSVLQDRKRVVQKQINKLEKDNIDLSANSKGYKYSIDGEPLTATQFYDKMATNSMLDRLRNNEDVKIDVGGDKTMQLMVDNWIAASKRGYGDRMASNVAGSLYDVFEKQLRGRTAQLLSLTTSNPDKLQERISAASVGQPYLTPLISNAMRKAKESGGSDDDIIDNFMINYWEEMSTQSQELKGLQYLKEEDVIDRIMDGDITGAAIEASEISAGSIGYLGAALIPYAGVGLIGSSIQYDKYYERRKAGDSKSKAATASGLSALVNTADAFVDRLVIGDALKIVTKGANKMKAVGYTKEATKNWVKDVITPTLAPFYKEMPTEFAQGTIDVVIDQIADGESIDLSKAIRHGGMIEAIATMPTSTIIATPVALITTYAKLNEDSQARKIESAIGDIIFQLPKVKNKDDIKVLRKEAQNLSQELNDILVDSKDRADNATEEQSKELQSLAASELTLEKLLSNENISKDTKEIIQERLDKIKNEKEEILNSIESSKKETEESGAESTQEEEMTAKTVSAEEQEVIDQEKPSKERVEKEIDNIVEKTKKRGVGEDTNPDTIIENVIGYLQGSKLYEEMTDTERDAMYKSVISKLGEKVSSSPSVDRLFQKKKAETISMTTKQIIETEAKAVRDAEKSINDARKSISDVILKMGDKGSIPSKMVKSIVKRVNAVNLNSQESIDRLNSFIDRQFKIAANKDARTEDKTRKSKQKKAAKKLKELGVLRELQNPIVKLLSTPTELIPESVKGIYDEITSQISKAGTKYFNTNRDELLSNINKANKEIEREQNSVADVFDRIKESFTEKLDFETQLLNLVEDGDITESEANLISKYRDVLGIESKDSEAAAKDRGIEFGIAQDNLSDVTYEDVSDLEESALNIAKSITQKEFNQLPDHAQRELIRGMEMASNGIISGKLLQSANRIEWLRRQNEIPISEVKPNGFIDTFRAKIWNGLKNVFRKPDKKKSFAQEKIESAPLFNLDEVFRVDGKVRSPQDLISKQLEGIFTEESSRFKSTKLYENIFRPLGQAFSKAESELKKIKTRLTKAEELLSSNDNKRFKQKIRIMLYQIQQEFESNPNNPEVNSAREWVESILNDDNPYYTANELDVIKDVFNSVSVDGEVNLKKIKDGFTDNESKAEKLIRMTYDSLQEKAELDAAFQGLPFIARENYVHLPRLSKGKDGDQLATDINELANSFRNPSVKSKNVLKRTGKTHSISLDPIHNAFGAAKQTISSYHMNPAIKGAAMLFRGLNNETKGNKSQSDIVRSLEEVLNDIILSEYGKISEDTILLDSIAKSISRGAYRAMLAGVQRAVVEFLSNSMHAVGVYANEFADGLRISNNIDGETLEKVFTVLPSTQSTRLSGDGLDYDSKDVEANLVKQKDFFENQRLTNDVANLISPATRTGKKWLDKIISISEKLLSVPDISVAKRLFIGTFNTKFKELTGKDADFDKIANDKEYYKEFKNEIELATEDADNAVTTSISSKNIFDGIPKNIKKADASSMKKAFQMMNRFMTTFRVFEYYSAVRGVDSLLGKGKLNRKQGAMLLAMTASRMAIYKLGLDLLAGAVYSIISSVGGWNDDEDDFLSDTKEGVPNALIGALVTLSMGRNIGNMGTLLTNWGVEYINRNYGEGITWDEKDGFSKVENSVVFSKIPTEISDVYNPEKAILDVIVGNMGAYSPVTDAIVDGTVAAMKKETVSKRKTKEKYEDELYWMTPFKLAGSMGLIPAYRDVKGVVNERFYDKYKSNKRKRKKKNRQ